MLLAILGDALHYLARVSYFGWHLFLREFKVRYRRTMIGYTWALVPVLTIATTALLLDEQFGLSKQVPYSPFVIWLATSLTIWQVFADAFSIPQQLGRRSRVFLRNQVVDLEGIIVCSGLLVLVNLLIKVVLLIVLFIAYAPDRIMMLAGGILASVPLAVFGLAVGTILVPISLIYWDIYYVLPYIQYVFLFTVPVLYEMPSQGTLHALNFWNPITYLFVPVRDLILMGSVELLAPFSAVSIGAIILFIVSSSYYRTVMPRAMAHI